MTDEDGIMVELMDYYPFGTERLSWTDGSSSEQKTFIGEYSDDETGLSYLNARYYNGDSGQFLSEDSVFLGLGTGSQQQRLALLDPQLQNSYAYARNNPVALKDINGNWPSASWFSDAITSAAQVTDIGYNFITLGAGEKAAEMGRTGLTAGGVAQVAAGVAFGTVSTSLAAIDIGAMAGGIAMDVGLMSARQQTVQNKAINTSNTSVRAPDFVVTPGGTVYPTPAGSTGPTPVINSVGNQTGSAFTGGSGGANGQVSSMRIMNPNQSNLTGYIKYENSYLPKPQGVNPYSGQTVSAAEAHHPIDY